MTYLRYERDHEHDFKPYRRRIDRTGIYVMLEGMPVDIANVHNVYDQLLTEGSIFAVEPRMGDLQERGINWVCDCGEQGYTVPA